MSYPQSILIIDDNPDFLSILETALLVFGEFKVQKARGGIRGLEWAERKKFDVIVTDLIMPGVDGEQVIENVRQGEMNSDTLIILLTATPDIGEALQIENVEIVAKPIEPNALVDRIWAAWAKHEG